MAKHGKRRIPKQVMGIKIPKDLRKRGEALIDAAGSPEGREVMAGVMGIAATAMAAIAAKNAARAATGEAGAAEKTAVPPIPPQPERHDPPRGTTREPDFQNIADTIGRNVEIALERMFGAKKA